MCRWQDKQDDNIQPWRIPSPIWNQSIVPCPVLSVISWSAYRFFRRQVRWSAFPVWRLLKKIKIELPYHSARQKDRTLRDELPRSIGAQHATEDQWRNNSRKNEEMESKKTQRPVVDVTGDGSKVWCCKEQYCIGTWNVKSMNQGKLEVVKQEMERVNVDILGISEL